MTDTVSICWCGTQAGYPHSMRCPWPYFGEKEDPYWLQAAALVDVVLACLDAGQDAPADIRYRVAKLIRAWPYRVGKGKADLVVASRMPAWVVDWAERQVLARRAA